MTPFLKRNIKRRENMYILKGPLAFIIRPIYELIGNYGITLIVATILVRLCTIPLTIKSQKNTTKTQLIQPEIIKLQNKYKNDRDTLAREMQKVYKKYDVNPLGGCLPLILQMLILFGFIGVIYNPIECILQLDKASIVKEMKELGQNKEWIEAVRKIKGQDVNICGMNGVSEAIRSLGKEPVNFNLFGMNLANIPSGTENLMQWVFPALAFLATIASSLLTKKQMQAQSKGNEQAAGMGNAMVWMMPAMTLFFIFMMPIAMSLYWFVSTALQLLQQTVINKAITNKIQAEITLKGKK